MKNTDWYYPPRSWRSRRNQGRYQQECDDFVSKGLRCCRATCTKPTCKAPKASIHTQRQCLRTSREADLISDRFKIYIVMALKLTQSLDSRDTLFLLKFKFGRRSIGIIRSRVLMQFVVGKRFGLAVLVLRVVLFRFVVRHDAGVRN